MAQTAGSRQTDPHYMHMVLASTEELIDKGDLVPPVEFQKLMGWASLRTVWRATESRRIFYLPYEEECYFPTFFGIPAYDRKQVQAVTRVLGDLPGGAKLQFFVTRKGSLGGLTPLQALAAGRFSKVTDIAAAFSEG